MRVFVYFLFCLMIFPFNYKDYDSLLKEHNARKLSIHLIEGIKKNPRLYFPMFTLMSLSMYDLKDDSYVSLVLDEKILALFDLIRAWEEGNPARERDAIRKIDKFPSTLAFIIPLITHDEMIGLPFVVKKKCMDKFTNILKSCDRKSLYKRAGEVFRVAIASENMDDIIPAFDVYARKLEKEGRKKELLKICDKFFASVKRQGLSFPLAYYYMHLGAYYEMAGQRVKRIEALENSGEGFLKIRDYKQALKLFEEAGRDAENMNSDFRAETLYEKAASISKILGKFNPEIILSLVRIYYKRGINKKAIILCESALKRKLPVYYRVKFLHYLGLLRWRSPVFGRFAAYRYMREAYKLAIRFDEMVLSSLERRYEFLKEKASIIEDYSRAQMKLGEAIIILLIVLSGSFLGLYFFSGWILEKRSALIGPYRIKGVIARGGMGTVYRAKSLNTGEEVALKVLRRELYTEQAAERFKRETMFLKKLNHPNIVRFISSGQHGERLYFAMELIKGDTLQNIIERIFPLPLETNFQIVHQILSGLKFIHSKGIVHRDIKPSNVMVVGGERTLKGGKIPKGAIKLMDFGISKSEELFKITTTGEVMGTPYFMAPELITSGDSDRRSDIYSFGVTVYWLLTREIPFFHPELATVLYKIVNLEPLPPSKIRPGIPRCLDEIILVCMEKNPEDRYQDVDELLEELFQCEEELKGL